MSSEMLRNIQEQPDIAQRCLDLNLSLLESLQHPDSLQLLACGSSYHAALVAQFWFEQLAGKPTMVFDAANMCDRNLRSETNSLLILLSQSGTTADIFKSVETISEAQKSQTLGITNRSNTPLHKFCTQTIQTPAGEELAVAATKSFLSQLILLIRLALSIKTNGSSSLDYLLDNLFNKLPSYIECSINACKSEKIASKISSQNRLIILGDGINYPIALESSLKIKETTYIPSEGLSLGSFMHGPIAIIEPGFPVIAIVKRGFSKEPETLKKLERLKAYGAHLIGVSSEPHGIFDDILQVAETPDLLAPIVNVIPLQLLAHEIAKQRGLDIDRPRNLTKSIDK
jgi:glucosamine 6-phosphate synthetase-like amidotransferase/phosphosugar isomerase protein